MYSIEEFKQELIPWLENFLKEQYGDAHITIEPTEKTNQVLTGINCIIHNNGIALYVGSAFGIAYRTGIKNLLGFIFCNTS